MVFKRNITVTLACVITECLMSLMPTILLIYVFFLWDRVNELFSTLLIVPFFILITNFALFLVSLIAKLFIKTEYCVNKNCLAIRTKDEVKEIKYDEIAGMTYDFGDLTKFNTKPSQLVLFDKEFKQLLSINNPSIIMVHLIKKKCKHVKMSYYHNKRFLLFLSLINGITLFIGILVKIFS